MSIYDLVNEIRTNKKITIPQCRILANKAIDEMNALIKHTMEFEKEDKKYESKMISLEKQIESVKALREKEANEYCCEKCGSTLLQCMCY